MLLQQVLTRLGSKPKSIVFRGLHIGRNSLPVLALMLLGLFSCRRSGDGIPQRQFPTPDVSNTPAGLHVYRVDRLLEAPDAAAFHAAWDTLYRRHTAFTVYYRDWILNLPSMPQARSLPNPQERPLDTAISGLLYRTFADAPMMRALQDSVRQRLDLPAHIKDLRQAYRYHRHYQPLDSLLPVYAYSGVFGAPVEWTPDFLAVANTMFLGRDFSAYTGFSSEQLPRYLFHRLEPEQWAIRIMETQARARWQPDFPDNTALQHMLYEGKILAYLDRVFPQTPDSLKIGFTDAQWRWAEYNQEDAWAMVVTEELLYSRRSADVQRLTGEGPHTKGMSMESPARMGTWMGWQIARAWWDKHPDADFDALFAQQDAQAFLSESGWKPRAK